MLASRHLRKPTCDAAVRLPDVVEPQGRQVEHLSRLHAAAQRSRSPVRGVALQVRGQRVHGDPRHLLALAAPPVHHLKVAVVLLPVDGGPVEAWWRTVTVVTRIRHLEVDDGMLPREGRSTAGRCCYCTCCCYGYRARYQLRSLTYVRMVTAEYVTKREPGRKRAFCYIRRHSRPRARALVVGDTGCAVGAVTMATERAVMCHDGYRKGPARALALFPWLQLAKCLRLWLASRGCCYGYLGDCD